MRRLKAKIDTYFDLEGDVEGQVIYYGMLFIVAILSIAGIITVN